MKRARDLLLTLAILAFASPSSAQGVGVIVELDAIGAALEPDPSRGVIYVSLPVRNEVAVVSMATYQVVDRIVVGSRPRGMDLSLDETRLFVALNGAGAVAVVDLATRQVTEIDVASELGHSETWDVVEAQPGRLFVSASPYSYGFSWIVQVLLAQGNAASRVASNNIIRAMPIFALSPDHAYVYVGEGFSPNSIYKLDLGQPTAPIVLEDVHGAVSGSDQLAVSPDGARINTGSGQVLRTASLAQAGVVSAGIPRYGATPGVFYVAEYGSYGGQSAAVTISTFDRTTYLSVGSRSLSCPVQQFSYPSDFEVLENDETFVLLAGDLVCVSTSSGAIADGDGDGIGDPSDNCLGVSNSGQENADGDLLGDACDPYPTSADNLGACTAEVAGQASLITQLGMTIADLETENADLRARIDSDRDGIPDVRDQCPGSKPKKKVDLAGCQKWQRK